MRILVFHGYLLHGTGSNVYNARLCAALARAGHTVDLLSQDRRPEDLGFVDAVGTWHDGRPRVEVIREPVTVTAWRPDIGGLLPVYVADRYEGIEARTFLECTDEEIERYVAANVTAVRDVVARARPDIALANHLVMGPLILSRALGDDVPYAVKIHGSALEYTVKPQPERFLPRPPRACARWRRRCSAPPTRRRPPRPPASRRRSRATSRRPPAPSRASTPAPTGTSPSSAS
jgi:hypothetical protein